MNSSYQQTTARRKRGRYLISVSILAGVCRRRLKEKINPESKKKAGSKVNPKNKVSPENKGDPKDAVDPENNNDSKNEPNPTEKQVKRIFADEVIDRLIEIACGKNTTWALQAMKMLMQLDDRMRPIDRPEENQPFDRNAELENKTDEELEAEIEALDREINELQQAIASAKSGNP